MKKKNAKRKRQPTFWLSKPAVMTLVDVDARYIGIEGTFRWDMRVLRGLEKKGCLYPLPDKVPPPGESRRRLLAKATRLTPLGKSSLDLAWYLYEKHWTEEDAAA